MSATKLITADRLREVLRYDAESGLFYWLVNASTRRPAGSIAGRVGQQGYVQIHIDAIGHQAHRLAWLYVHGALPVATIDHINGIRHDNRIANLRELSVLHNSQNRRRPQRNNRLGVLGVRQLKSGLFQPRIRVGDRLLYLGSFSTPEEAHQVYVQAKRALHVGNTL